MTERNEKMIRVDGDEGEFKKYAYELPDDLTFPKATIDPKFLHLQKEVTEFITSVILKHEMDFYNLVKANFLLDIDNILGSTNPTIIQMITEITNIFYNKIYYEIQRGISTPITNLVLNMRTYADYESHILLDKMIRLTIDAHLDVVREKLALNDLELYQKSVLNQINIYLLSKNLLHILSKGIDEDGPFINLPDGQKAFDIVIDKNIDPVAYVNSIETNNN
jgi:hypothetical protein